MHMKHIFVGILSIFYAIAFGFFHSIDIITLFLYLRANDRLRRILGSCLVMNGVFFLSLWLASFFISPMWVFGEELLWGKVIVNSITNKSNPNPIIIPMHMYTNYTINNNNSNNSSFINKDEVSIKKGIKVVGKVWFHVFDILWVLPMYAITQTLGLCWYSTLYIEAYAEKKRRLHLTEIWNITNSPSFYKIITSISEILFKILVTTIYAILIIIIEMILFNPIGFYIAFIMKSWLYAFYVFDYRFCSQYIFQSKSQRYMRITLSETLKIFESQWAYFLGFGATQSFVINMLQYLWISFSWFSIAAIVSVLFGVHVVLSVEAIPGPKAPFVVHMFTPLFAVCGVVLRTISNTIG